MFAAIWLLICSSLQPEDTYPPVYHYLSLISTGTITIIITQHDLRGKEAELEMH